MTVAFRQGRFGVRLAVTPGDIAACQGLRHLCFHGTQGRDHDHFDALCSHVMVADDAGLACTFRLRHVTGRDVAQTYTGQSYDLTRLAAYPQPMLELGRFCIRPGAQDADVLRMAWGALAQVVDAEGVGLLFGCSSFDGLHPRPAAFGLLAQHYAAPAEWAPLVRSDAVIAMQGPVTDRRAAVREIPPLLRSYLNMGGWVSDHAVIDRSLNTLHVFTGLEIAKIPPARARVLRAVMGACT